MDLKDLKNINLKDIQVPNSVAIGIILVVALVVALVIAGVFYLNSRDDIREVPAGAPAQAVQTADAPAADATQVETLPQTARNFDGSQDKNPFGTEKLGAIAITGIVSSSYKSTAILEAGGASFVVSEGDQLPQSAWSVKTITKDSVTLSCDTSEKTFYMEKRGAAGSVTK